MYLLYLDDAGSPGNPAEDYFVLGGVCVEEARGLLKSVLHVAASSYETTRLFACAIHKKSFPAADPVELAFEDLASVSIIS